MQILWYYYYACSRSSGVSICIVQIIKQYMSITYSFILLLQIIEIRSGILLVQKSSESACFIFQKRICSKFSTMELIYKLIADASISIGLWSLATSSNRTGADSSHCCLSCPPLSKGSYRETNICSDKVTWRTQSLSFIAQEFLLWELHRTLCVFLSTPDAVRLALSWHSYIWIGFVSERRPAWAGSTFIDCSLPVF